MDPALVRFIREEIKKSMNVVLTGQALLATEQDCSVVNLFPGMQPIEKIPVAHPYGFVSSAIDTTLAVTVRLGEHVGNRLVILHRDTNRPSDINTGETVMYSATGHQVRCELTGIKIGSKNASNPLVLGDILQNYLDAIYTSIQNLYNAVIAGTTALTTVPGSPTAPNPLIATTLTTDLANLTTAKLQYSDTPATNFVSLVNMTERGTPVQGTPKVTEITNQLPLIG